MADNTAITPGAGETIRGKDRAGVKTQVMGIDVGIDGGAELLLSPTNPMPVNLIGNAGGLVAGGALGVEPNAIQEVTYTAVCDGLTTGALTAYAGYKVLELEHAAGATKTVKIRKIVCSGWQTTSLAGLIYMKVFRGTAAASAGSPVTPNAVNAGSAAAEVTVKSGPTIVATTVISMVALALLPSTSNSGWQAVEVYKWEPGAQQEPLTMRAGNLETVLMNIYSSVAHNLSVSITVYFTEE